MTAIFPTVPRRAARVAALLAVLLLAVGVGGAAARTEKASLTVARLKPFTVHGAGFKAREHVVLTLTGGAKGAAKGTATPAGRLTVVFPLAKVTACTAYRLRAVGSAGSIATSTKTVSKAACTPVATVKFVGTSVIVAGLHFLPGERLAVNLSSNDEPHKRAAVASSAGAFSLNFGQLGMSECSPYVLTITGSLGSRFTTSQEALPC